MNITYIVHQFYPECWTGTEKFVLRVSLMMQKAGHRVSVITYGLCKDSCFNRNIGDILYKEFNYEGIRVIALRHKRAPKNLDISLGDGSMNDIAKYLLSTEKPDIVHIGHPMRVNEIAIVAKSFNIPYIITLTDFWMLCPKTILIDSGGNLCSGPSEGKVCAQYCPEYSSSFITHRLTTAKSILLEAQKIISPSNFLGSIFKEEFRELDIEVIEYGISHNVIKNNKKYKKGDALIFCYAGSLSHHKGVHVLMEAFKKIRSQNIALRIFGTGADPLYFNKLLSMAKGDPRIKFGGVFPKEKVGDILSDVDVVVVPSLWYENCPHIVLEALVCRTPVVISSMAGMPEYIKDDITGFTFSRGNRDGLKEILEKIVDNPTILNDVKENMKRILIPTIEQEAYAYHKLYTDI